jgi:hypothetical protein
MNAIQPSMPPSQQVSPHQDPSLRERDDDNRAIVARWNIGAPEDGGAQRQARFQVCHWKRSGGFTAHLTTVIMTDVQGSRSELFTTSLMRQDLVYESPVPRYSAKALGIAFDEAMNAVRKRFDEQDPAITRHFDHNGPVPQD